MHSRSNPTKKKKSVAMSACLRKLVNRFKLASLLSTLNHHYNTDGETAFCFQNIFYFYLNILHTCTQTYPQQWQRKPQYECILSCFKRPTYWDRVKWPRCRSDMKLTHSDDVRLTERAFGRYQKCANNLIFYKFLENLQSIQHYWSFSQRAKSKCYKQKSSFN